jgi:ABC-2 type transport system permease protein
MESNAVHHLEVFAGPGQLEWTRVTIDAALADIAFQTSRVLSKPQYELVEQRRTLSEFTYIFPGLLALALLNLGIFGTANPLLRARDRGTLRHLAVTPVSTAMILQGQILLRLIIASSQLALLLIVGRLLFKVNVAGNNWTLFAFLFIGAVMLISMGYAIAGAAPSQEAGGVIILLVEFGLMFLGQVFVDFSSIPGLSTVVKLIPLTYLSDGCRQALLGVPGMFSLRADFAMLVAWTCFLLFAAIRTFRFDMEAR